MNIILGNQKGGVGKSTLCFLLANYFSNVKNKGVTCIDFDSQLTLFKQWKEQVDIFDNEVPYEVICKDLEESSVIMDALSTKKFSDAYFFIDVPGNLSDDNLIYIYQNADIIICPFHYDVKTFESTLVFAKVIREYLKLETPIIFIPNRIKKSVNYSKKTQMNSLLEPYGIISKPIYDLVSMQRQSLFDKEDSSITVNEEFLEQIYLNCIKS